MTEYVLRLFIMLPLVAGLAWGSLWLWRKAQPALAAMGGTGGAGGTAGRTLKIVEAQPMGVSGRLAVVEFDGQRLLIAVTRGRIECIATGGGTDG